MNKRKWLEKIYEKFGFGQKFSPYLSKIDTADLAEAIYLGHVVKLVYGSDKEGEWFEYEHEFQSRPALYQIGVPGGEAIEALLDVADENLRDVVLLGSFVELEYEADDGSRHLITDQGWIYFEPETGIMIIETPEEKYAVTGWRIGRWIMG